MKTSEVLIKALRKLGPKGEHWQKGNLASYPLPRYKYLRWENPCDPNDDRASNFCSLGVVANTLGLDSDAIYDEKKRAAVKALEAAMPQAWRDANLYNLYDYNDHKNTEFKHVRALFHKAIRTERAKERRLKRA